MPTLPQGLLIAAIGLETICAKDEKKSTIKKSTANQWDEISMNAAKKPKNGMPEWANRSFFGMAWYATGGDRKKTIRHMGLLMDGGEEEAGKRLDYFLKNVPEAAAHNKKTALKARDISVAQIWNMSRGDRKSAMHHLGLFPGGEEEAAEIIDGYLKKYPSAAKRPKWAYEGTATATVWYATRGDRKETIDHIARWTDGDHERVEKALDMFLKRHPEAADYAG